MRKLKVVCMLALAIISLLLMVLSWDLPAYAVEVMRICGCAIGLGVDFVAAKDYGMFDFLADKT